MRVHRRLDRVEVASEAVVASTGLKTIETADGGRRRGATFNDETGRVVLRILAVGFRDLSGSESGLESIEAVLRVIKSGGRAIGRAQDIYDFGGFDLGA